MTTIPATYPHIGLPLFPTPEDLTHLAAYLTEHGWTCQPPGAALTQTLRRRHRRNDGPTARAGAAAVGPRAGTQKALLLATYTTPHGVVDGLTDDDAAHLAGLRDDPRCCWWKRCSELRDAGLIEPIPGNDGEPLERLGWAGTPRIVCRITDAGRAVLASLRTQA